MRGIHINIRESDCPLVWNVFRLDFNARCIKVINIFDHYGFMQDCIKANKRCRGDRQKFEEEVRTSLMYFCWSKCEWEVIISAWPPSENCQDEKVDAYTQVAINWDRFVDYLWNNRKVLRELERSSD